MPIPTLNADELNALMSAIQDGRVKTEPSGARGPVVAYDLTSQDRVIRGQMPTLDAINEQIASTLGTSLAGRTRMALRVNSSPATLMKFADFSSLLAPPATVCVLGLGQGNGQAIVVLEPGLADTLLAAALGDRKIRADEVPSEPRRELTSVERQVLRRLMTFLTDAMTTAWGPIVPFRPEVLRFEPDPRLAAIAPPNEAAILCTFELTGGLTGRLQLALPFSAVESAKKLLSSPPRLNSNSDRRFASALSRELEQVNVELRSVLGKTQLKLQKVLDLELGDVLLLDSSEESPLPIFVEGRQKLTGRPSVSGGAMALVLDSGVQATPPSLGKPAGMEKR
jgi:flagellar motor switch protein FliM